jgi:hypothetical protein
MTTHTLRCDQAPDVIVTVEGDNMMDVTYAARDATVAILREQDRLKDFPPSMHRIWSFTEIG